MLGTYFAFILILFISLIVGAIMAYTGNLKSKIKDPLYKSIEMYKENSTDSKVVALANAWNTIQKEVKLN